uniref:Putative ribonuclease H-like domain-containing protein n=1 Tax=Tanacetum cinerariifolium TaxID=118510 RepID=A0A6L2M655_TANCI|nr:putative ribonuclease H-like domain-containing protein [Tanacetum cinerariifolium]
MQKRRNDVKARTTLLLALPDEHQLRFNKYETAQELYGAILKTFGGNEATKKTKKNQLKQYHLEFMNVEIEQDDLNQKFLTSLAPEWLMYTIVWRNIDDLDTMILDDVYNHLKVYEPEVQKKSESNSQIWLSFLQPTPAVEKLPVLVMTLADRFWKKTCKKITIQGTDVAGFDKSMVECFNCHKMGHFARECRVFRSQDRGRRESYRQGSKEEELASKALMAKSFEARLVKKEKKGLDSKLTGFESASKYLDTLLGSQRSDKNKEGLGYSVVPPFLLKPPPSKGSNTSDLQNSNYFVFEHGESSDSIMSKPMFKFVKTADSPSVIKTNKVETARKPLVKYAEMYRNTSKSPKVRGNKGKAVKASTCWIWRPKQNTTEKGYWDSGCSRHITGNISYLAEYDPYDGGYVLFRQGGGKITGKDFKLKDDTNVLLRTPRQHNMYSIDLNNIVPHKNLTCLVAKASTDESMMCHKRLGDLNFKTMNKLVRNNLVKGLPPKCFENDHTCVAGLNGKQHKASCKTKLVNSVSKPLHTLHMDLFGPTFVSSLNHKWYCLVVTDGFSRFTWTFFLRTKDETSGILKNFITKIENLKDLKVKIIRCDNRGEFKNKEMNELCSRKWIKREFNNARTLQPNGVAKRRNRTLIEVARTMLADAKLPVNFWVEAVNTACYVQNRILVNKSQNKTPYELFNSRTPAIGFLRPFGYHVMILNTLDHLGKFDAKGDESYFVGYSMSSKAFRFFDIDTLTNSMDYVLVVIAGTSSTNISAHMESSNNDAQDACNANAPESSGIFNPTATSKRPPAEQMESLTVESVIPTASSPVLTTCLDTSPKASSDTRLISKGVTSKEETPSLDNILTLSNSLDTQMLGQPGKDGPGKDVELHLYRFIIRSLMYLTASRPDIMFAVCPCARHQVTPKECHLYPIKRIFRYLKGHPKLRLWYPKESPFDLVAYSDSDYGGAT